MVYLNRRKLLGISLASGSMLMSSLKAHAGFSGDVQLRGQIERLERLPTLGLEGRESFRTSFRKFINTDLNRAARRRAETILKQAGIDPGDDVSMQEVVGLLEGDPVLMSHAHAFLNVQQAMWTDLQNAFHSDADRYLEEMENADKSGPGYLELNPDMSIPAYAAWEIHNQPGGYVGDPFAGHMYHFGTNNFFVHGNDQDGQNIQVAASVPIPADGRVKRCLDLGSSAGQTAIGLKERFPDAEVWGIDVGAPMVRYSHMRAVDLGVEVNFAQRLAEETHFPDGHFDTVDAYLLFHEVDIPAAEKIIREIYRVLRPGGTFIAVESAFRLGQPPRSAFGRWFAWWNDQWCSEVHFIPYTEYDYAKAFRDAGFELGSAPGPRNVAHMIATKPG